MEGRAPHRDRVGPGRPRLLHGPCALGRRARLAAAEFLRLDGRAISVDLSFEHAGRWYSLKAGYDEELRAFGPGALHLHRLLQHACEQGAEAFELLGDSDEFKRGWAKDERARHWLLSVPSSPRGRALYGYAAARERVRPVARRLLRSR